MARGETPKKVTLKSGEIRWRGRVDRGRDPVTNKRRQAIITARDEDEYWDKVARVRVNVRSSVSFDAEKLTMRAYLVDEWFPIRQSSGIRPVTIYRYERTIRRQLVPTFGALRLNRVTTMEIERWLRSLRGQGLAVNTIAGYFMVLRQAMRAAYQWELIARNPCVGIRLAPPQRNRKLRVWTMDEATRFLAAVRGDRDEAVWRLLLLGGLRVGEVIALHWRDLDVSAGTIAVEGSLTVDRDGKHVLGNPKTEHARRAVDLDPETVRVLTERSGRPGDLIFPGRGGRRWNNETIRVRLIAACTSAAVPVRTSHELRHTGITLALASGLPLKDVSERAGHARASITLDTYVHVLPGAKREIAIALGRLLDGPV